MPVDASRRQVPICAPLHDVEKDEPALETKVASLLGAAIAGLSMLETATTTGRKKGRIGDIASKKEMACNCVHPCKLYSTGVLH